MLSSRASARLGVVLAGAILAVAPLASCAGPQTAVTSPTSTQEGSEVELQTVFDSVRAADPRVEDPSGTVSYSGAAQKLTLVVLIAGDEPVSTEEVTAILVAARDSTPASIETITLIAREAEDEELIVDLQPAVSGLPDDTTPLWDGGLTMARVDLDKL